MIIGGIFIRLLLAPFFAHPYDVYYFYVVGQNIASGRWSPWALMLPYSYSYFLFAIPATLLFNAVSVFIGPTVISMSSLNPILDPGPQWGITVVPGLLYDFLLKIPLIASDAIIAVLVYRLASRQKNNEKLALTAAMLWFLNPLTIWISSGWGTMDTLPTLFTVLALYLALENKFVYSGVSIAVGMSLKYYPLVLAFPLLLIAYRRGGRKASLLVLTGLCLTSLVLFLPNLSRVVHNFAFTSSVPFISGIQYSGLSIWTAIRVIFPSFTLWYFPTIFAGVLMIVVYYWTWKKKTSDDICVVAAFFALPIAVLLLTYGFVGENFFVWLLPFGAILALNSLSKRLFWLLSLIVLFSSITDSLLPYYMLPMAPWIGNYLVRALLIAAPYRVSSGSEIVQGLTFGKIFLSSLAVVTASVIMFSSFTWPRNHKS